MKRNTEEQFAEAENSWDLPRLYTDLGKTKGKAFTEKEKLYLRGLLCGYGPAEIAKKCHKSAGALKVNFSKTLYQYVKILVHKENEKVENWTKIREWLEELGYKRSSLNEKNIVNFNGNNNTRYNHQNINSPSTGETELKHELEKAHLINEQQQKEIDYLKQQMGYLREIINLLKKA